INSLARYLATLPNTALQNQLSQFLERTLDDSANRRIIIPEAFLTADAILNLYRKITEGIVVNEHIIKQRMYEKLPFYAVENILMRSVKNGGDRQELHKIIRDKAMKVIEKIRNGIRTNLLEELQKDDVPEVLRKSISEIKDLLSFTGRSVEQVEEVSMKIKDYLEKTKHLEVV
ncbi:MAG: adenylosuccinate lyase, partial [Brevinematia bacterium]